MMARGTVNLQDGFLNQARREVTRLTITLLSGATFEGKVEAFDNFTLVVNSDGKRYLIYKHAISSMGPLPFEPRRAQRPKQREPEGRREPARTDAGRAESRGEKKEDAGAAPRPAPKTALQPSSQPPPQPARRDAEPFNANLKNGLAALKDPGEAGTE